MRPVTFEGAAFKEYNEWAKEDRKIFHKISELIESISRTPYEGIGKPEPLRYEFKGYWSRRIDEKNMLVYKISDARNIIITSCRNHYK